MLETLKKHLDGRHKTCCVGEWIELQDAEVKEIFSLIIAKSDDVEIAPLYKDLRNETQMPFKLTSFRAHLRGQCPCQ
jgi:hypothetical protein